MKRRQMLAAIAAAAAAPAALAAEASGAPKKVWPKVPEGWYKQAQRGHKVLRGRNHALEGIGRKPQKRDRGVGNAPRRARGGQSALRRRRNSARRRARPRRIRRDCRLRMRHKGHGSSLNNGISAIV